jgi:GNAT superfamily N-acetyltransferase
MPEWRTASAADAVALRDLEREANLVGLAHVFPAADFPFPDDDVLARWREVLADPAVTVDVVDSGRGLIALAAYDATVLRHLATHPSVWGTGLGRAGIERSGATRLWVLDSNHRARRLYASLGWQPTGSTRACPWPPHPVEIELAR